MIFLSILLDTLVFVWFFVNSLHTPLSKRSVISANYPDRTSISIDTNGKGKHNQQPLLKMAVMKAVSSNKSIVDHDNGLNDEHSYSLPQKIATNPR